MRLGASARKRAKAPFYRSEARMSAAVQTRPLSTRGDAPARASDRSDRASNFDLLRLVGASTVLLAHSLMVLRGRVWWNDHPGIWWSQLGNDFLNSFFVISGFLVTRSWQQDPHPVRYFTRRMLRLMPALGPMLLITLFVGAFVSTFSPGAYLHRGGTWVYLLNFTLFPFVDQLPGVFTHNPWPVAVSPQLWTLAYEFTCYVGLIVVAFIGARLPRGRYRIAAAILGIALLGGLSTQNLMLGSPYVNIAGIHTSVGIDMTHLGRVAGYFIGGAAFAYWGRLLPLRAVPAAISLVAFIVSSQVPWLFPFTVAFFVYAVLYFAMGAPQVARWATRYGDFSYGMYIYGFLVEQLVASVLSWTHSPLVIFAISWPIALLAAICSWHLVEKRALRLKPRGLRAAARRAAPVVEGGVVTAELRPTG